jgi:hypothetical protein
MARTKKGQAVDTSIPASGKLEDDVAAVYLPAADLTPWDKNPRRIPESAVLKVARIVATVAFGAPLLAHDPTKRVIAGHTRLLAFNYLLGLLDKFGAPQPGQTWPEGAEAPPEWWPTLKPATLALLQQRRLPVRMLAVSDEEADQLAIADNRLGQEAEWDYEALANILRGFGSDAGRLLTGFDPHELEPLLAAEWTPPPIGPLPGQEPGAGDVPPPPPAGAVVLTPEQRVVWEKALVEARDLWGEELAEGAALIEIAQSWLAAHEEDEEPEPAGKGTAAEDF